MDILKKSKPKAVTKSNYFLVMGYDYNGTSKRVRLPAYNSTGAKLNGQTI